MKQRLRIIALASLTIIIVCIGFYKNGFVETTTGKPTGKGKGKEKKEQASDNVSILHKWEMPDILKEISGIAWIDNIHFACIQDEKGIIYIYNTNSQKIEREITFADNGDFEDVCMVGNKAYVQRSDGHIFEVADINNSKPTVQEYKTFLTAKENMESLTYDNKNNRLLTITKEKEKGDNEQKNIYAFDLASKTMSEKPVIVINLGNGSGKKNQNSIRPSAMAVHPATRDIYILEGTKPKILILDARGNIKEWHQLDKGSFPQPEGINFSPAGKLFISNEGTKDAGNILEVEIK